MSSQVHCSIHTIGFHNSLALEVFPPQGVYKELNKFWDNRPQH